MVEGSAVKLLIVAALGAGAAAGAAGAGGGGGGATGCFFLQPADASKNAAANRTSAIRERFIEFLMASSRLLICILSTFHRGEAFYFTQTGM
jgi:hypothetical protein